MTQLSVGDANCPNGGVMLTPIGAGDSTDASRKLSLGLGVTVSTADVSSDVEYICNGTNGTNGSGGSGAIIPTLYLYQYNTQTSFYYPADTTQLPYTQALLALPPGANYQITATIDVGHDTTIDPMYFVYRQANITCYVGNVNTSSIEETMTIPTGGKMDDSGDMIPSHETMTLQGVINVPSCSATPVACQLDGFWNAPPTVSLWSMTITAIQVGTISSIPSSCGD